MIANFPTVGRLASDEWFRAAAFEYACRFPPDDARPLRYGREFPAFLRAFEPARALPYLANIARLDLLWIEAHVAADDRNITAADAAVGEPQRLEHAVLRPHVSARWGWFGGEPASTIWRANREGFDVPDDLAWQGEGALLLRPVGSVIWRPLSAGGCAFLDACAAGDAFEPAARRALRVEPDVDLGGLLMLLAMFDCALWGAAAQAWIDARQGARTTHRPAPFTTWTTKGVC